jgi:hypothetical protein
MVRQGINQVLLFGTYDIAKRYYWGDANAQIAVSSWFLFSTIHM